MIKIGTEWMKIVDVQGSLNYKMLTLTRGENNTNAYHHYTGEPVEFWNGNPLG